MEQYYPMMEEISMPRICHKFEVGVSQARGQPRKTWSEVVKKRSEL